MPEFNPVFNLIKSPPDKRDFTVLQAGICTADLPKVVANSKYRGIIRNQGNFGLCVPHSGRSTSVSLENEAHPNSNHDFSPLWLAKQLKQSPYTDYPDIEGDTLRALLKLMTHSPSIVPESLYPYSLYKGGLYFPELEVNYDPQIFQWGAYYKVETHEEMLGALASGYRILLGMYCGSDIRTNPWVRYPDGTFLGGHAIMLDSYGEVRPDYYDGPNSWGKEWGDNGVIHIHKDFIDGKFDDNQGSPFVMEAYAVSDYKQPMQAKKVVIHAGDQVALVDYVEYKLDQVPFITSNDRLVLPVRMISEYFGYSVIWDERQNTVTIYGNGKTIVLFIGSKYATVNNDTILLDQEPFITEAGRTMLPLRFVSEQLGNKVEWFDSTKTAVITRL